MALATTADGVTVGGAGTVAIAAVLGGAFFPGQRLVIGVLLAILLGWFGSRRWGMPLASEEWAGLALVGWGAVSAVVVGMSPLAAREVVTGWLVGWCLWVAARRAGPRAVVMGATTLVAAALLVVAGVGFEATGQGDLRVGGLLESPNVAAALLVVTLPLVGLLEGGLRRRWLILIAVALVGGVGLTGSRAGLLAVLAAGVALLPRGRSRVAVLAIGTGAIMAVVVWRFASHSEVLAWFRPTIWRAVLHLWATHPLVGVGPGGLGDAAGAVRLLHADHVGHHQYLISYAESTPLGLLVQTGLVGLGIAVVAAVLWLLRARRDGALSFAPLRSGVVGMAVMAAFHDVVTLEIVVWWWVLAFGLIEAARGTSRPSCHQVPEQPLARTARGLVLALIVLWGIVEPAWARWLWRTDPPDTVQVARAQAAERWYRRAARVAGPVSPR